MYLESIQNFTFNSTYQVSEMSVFLMILRCMIEHLNSGTFTAFQMSYLIACVTNLVFPVHFTVHDEKYFSYLFYAHKICCNTHSI